MNDTVDLLLSEFIHFQKSVSLINLLSTDELVGER
jgi:hypothetical protein